MSQHTFDDPRLQRLQNLDWNGETELPLPPQSVIDFSTRAKQPKVTVSELAAIVEFEPLLTAELLRNVNSSVRGLRKKIDSVAQAITLLGIPTSTTILLSSALSKTVQGIDSPLIPIDHFRRETIERALFARETARLMQLDQTLSYTAAMVQDILLPLITRCHEEVYRDYLQSDQKKSLVGHEREAFGWTHAEITAKTLLNWGFSQNMVLAVLDHHESPEQLLLQPGQIPISFPNAAAALLMDVMQQSPDGVTRLVDLTAINQAFSVMEVVKAVDEALESQSSSLKHPISMVQRLQMGMLNQLELRRQQSIVPGRQFGNYVIGDIIKESSMGAIYRAHHIRLKRPTALKILRSDKTNRDSIAQFEQEVQLTCTLRHPNTVAIFDYGHTPDDLFYYAMELVNGVTLSELVTREGPLSDGRVLPLLLQTCGSLAEAHCLDLIHRDIKPENIMVSRRAGRPDHVTLLDFGLVTSIRPSQSDQSLKGVVGTPLYMSPEAALGRTEVGPRSDLYSVAAVGYFLLTGEPLFRGETVVEVLQHHVRTAPIPPSKRTTNPISPQLEHLLMRCLRKNPDDRPASALELGEELANCVPAVPWSAEEAEAWWEQFEKGEDRVTESDEETDPCFASTLINLDPPAILQT